MKNHWIQTYTGQVFDLEKFNPDTIKIEDIAHSLSLICRFTGHCEWHYSVAQHSIYVYQYAPDSFKKQALLHDMTEAYLNDMSKPLKNQMWAYSSIEERLGQQLFEFFGLNWPISTTVKYIDLKMLKTEHTQLMKETPKPWDCDKLEPYNLVIEKRNPTEVELEFLEIFYSLFPNWKE